MNYTRFIREKRLGSTEKICGLPPTVPLNLPVVVEVCVWDDSSYSKPGRITALAIGNKKQPCRVWSKQRNRHLATNSTELVTSRLDTTHSTCRALAFWLCRACRTARLDTLVSTRSTRRTCRFETWRDEPSGIWAFLVVHTRWPKKVSHHQFFKKSY